MNVDLHINELIVHETNAGNPALGGEHERLLCDAFSRRFEALVSDMPSTTPHRWNACEARTLEIARLATEPAALGRQLAEQVFASLGTRQQFPTHKSSER